MSVLLLKKSEENIHKSAVRMELLGGSEMKGTSSSISLPQLTEEMVKNARKTRLCSFAVAIEGWRRGLKLKWYTRDSEHYKDMIIFGVNPPGRLFSLSSDKRTHYFFRTRGDKVTNEAVEIGSDKEKTKILMEKNGVPVPKGRGFGEHDTDEEIINYGLSLGFPLVVKPTDGSLGLGVVTNIVNEEELREALDYVRHQLGYDDVIVEQYIVGKEYRLYVIEDEVIAAYNRVPANITGDGIHTIEELIELKNLERRRNARLNSCLIEIDVEIINLLEEKGYTLDTVLPKGKLLYLREKSNISIGGDPIDVTDDLSDEVKQIAINALKTVPGLYHGGVDIIINEGNVSRDPAVVLELNPTAQIGGILFPLKGKARNIPAAIIDYYFPETKGMDTSGSKIYFDMSTVLEPLENRSAIEVEVAPAPMGKLYSKQLLVTGDVQKQSFHEWIKKEAVNRNLHGHVKRVFYDTIEIVVAGTNLDKIQDFKRIITESPRNAKVRNIREKKWNGPIKIGFEINERYNTSRFRSAETALRILNRDFTQLDRKKQRVEKVNRYILESNSWKLTAPIRKIGAHIRQFKKIIVN